MLLINSLGKLGSIDFIPDNDGIGRHYAVKHNYVGWHLLSLPAAIAKTLGYQLPETEHIRIDWQGIDPVVHHRIPYAELLANARGELNNLPPSIFKDKIILVGSTALGLHDLIATPISGAYPGISVLANTLDNLITKEYQSEIPVATSLTAYVCMLIVCLSAALKYGRLTATKIALAFMGGILFISVYLTLSGIILSSLAGLSSILSFALLCFFDLYFEKKRKLGDTIDLFSRFLDPKIVNEIVEGGISDSLLDTKAVEVTVLFSDIRNFTSISEERTPGEVVNLLNHYFDKQIEVLFKHQATLDKFIGDAVMAFWGAPLSYNEHPILAIQAALDMMDQLEIFRNEYGFKDLDSGIGIHSGEAVVGMIGAKQRYDYTAIGDTVNLASRIEGLTKNCAHILVSESTMIIAKGYFRFEERGEFKVKGRNELVRVYEPFRK